MLTKKIVADAGLLPVSVAIMFILISQIPVLTIVNAGIKTWILLLGIVVFVTPFLFMLSQLKHLSSSRFFAALLTFYFLFHLLYQYTVYYTGQRATGDTGAIEQSLWNLLNHGSFSNTIEGQYFGVAPAALNHFAVHNSPILLFLLVPYAVYPSMVTLIFIKSILVIITGWLALRYVANSSNLENSLLSGIVPFALLIQVPILIMPDFYESVFIPPLLIWSALAFRLEKIWQFLISCFLLAMVKETIFPVLFIWAAIAWWKTKRKTYITGPLVIGLSSFLFSFFVIIPFYNNGQSSSFLNRVLPSLMALDLKIILVYLLQIFSLWGGVPFVSLFAWLALPDIIINSLLSGGFNWTTNVGGRFQMVIIVALFIATCEAIPNISNYLKSIFNPSRTQSFFWIVVMVSSIFGLLRGWSSFSPAYYGLQQSWQNDINCIKTVSETREPVMCDYKLCGYVAKREAVWSVEHNLPEAAKSQAMWYIGRKNSITMPSITVGWRTVCEGNTVTVMKRIYE